MIETWILPALLGLGLAASTGLRTFLPLLMLALAAHFQLFGVELNDKMQWLGSIPAIAALGVATGLEFIGDKIPAVDHVLHAVGFVTRPLAAVIAAWAVFSHVDPMVAAVAAVIIGAPTAIAFNAAQGGTRVASTATTGGLGNPVVSFVEDILATAMVLIAFILPLLIPVVIGLVLWAVIVLARKASRAVSSRPS